MSEEKLDPAVNFDRAHAIGEIIILARNVESQLHRIAGGEVAGIHALTELLGSRLPEETKRRLHYIASVRNQAAHEAEFSLTAEGFRDFQYAAEQTAAELDRLFPPPEPQTNEAKSDPDELAVERELYLRIANKCTLLGYFPVLGAVNLVRLFLKVMWGQVGLLLLILFYVSALPIIYQGIIKPEERGLLYVGIGTAVLDYIATLFTARKIKILNFPKLVLYFFPFHIFYLLTAWLLRLDWGRLLTSGLGLAALTGAAVLGCKGLWEYMFYALAVSWVISIYGAWRYRPAAEDDKDK